jgi:hypothetical protein
MTSAERAQWRLTGLKPGETAPDADADPSPAPAAAQPASTDARPPTGSAPVKGKGVKARSAELDAEIVGLQDKLKLRAALREELAQRPVAVPDVTPAASSPAAAPDLGSTLRAPDASRPMLSEEQFFATFPAATYGQYGVYTAKYVLAEHQGQQAREAQQRQFSQEWSTNVDAVKAERPDYAEQIDRFKDLPTTPANTAIFHAISESRNARLALYLADHLDLTRELVAMPPASALVKLGEVWTQISGPAGSPRPPSSVTKAPPPPPEIGSRASMPADEIEAARASGDWRRYRDAANARDIAARRRG